MAEQNVRSFRGRAVSKPSGGAIIPLPFDPAEPWGRRDRYHVTGTIESVRFRSSLVLRQGTWQIELGLKSPSSSGLRDGQSVTVQIWPEGPQHEQLAPDIAAALSARPQALMAFEGLAT